VSVCGRVIKIRFGSSRGNEETPPVSYSPLLVD